MKPKKEDQHEKPYRPVKYVDNKSKTLTLAELRAREPKMYVGFEKRLAEEAAAAAISKDEAETQAALRTLKAKGFSPAQIKEAFEKLDS